MRISTQAATFLAAVTILSSTDAFSVLQQQSRASLGLRSSIQHKSHGGIQFAQMAPLQATPVDEDTVFDSTTTPEAQRLKAMAAKLRQEAATMEAQRAEESAKAAQKAFAKFDVNNDGEISVDELKAALEKTFKMDLPSERVERLMQDFDKSGDGKLQAEEFVGIDQFRNRLEALAQEERKKALEATKVAQKETELAKFVEAQMELINDKEPTGTDKIVSVLPYLFPLMDGLMFGRFLLDGAESNPVVGALALLYTVYRSIPLSGFISFLALNTLAGNLSINRLVRFNMQQAIFMDIALFIPGLLATLVALASNGLGVQIPPGIGELGSDAIFFTLVASIGYATVSSLLGATPDKLPFISNAVNNRIPSVDMFDAEGRFDPSKRFEQNNKNDDQDNKENKTKDD